MKEYLAPVILLLLLIPAATATMVTVSPTRVDPGDTVRVNLKDLSDGTRFSLGISAEFDVIPGEKFAFTARDLILPFSLDSGEVGAYTKGTSQTGLSAKKGETIIRLGDSADEKGEYQITQPYSISSGTYDFLTLSGRASSTAKSIITELTLTGTKRGPDDGTISFVLEGIESGTITIAVSIDGSEVHSQRITIGSAPELGETELSSPDPGTPSSPGSSGAPLFPSDPTTPALPTTSSADGKVSLTGADIKGASLLSLPFDGVIPPGMATGGRTYSITPADRALDAVISFPAPNTTATIARLEDGAWSLIPSKIEGDRITAKVTRGGSYAVLVLAEVPTQMVTTPTTTAPATTPAATPLAPLIPVAACAILILVQGRKD